MRHAVLCSWIAVAATGCARRTDAATRRAWQEAGAGNSGSVDGATGGALDGDTDALAGDPKSAPKFGWERVEQILDEGLEVIRLAPDSAAFADLAQQWCDVEPEARATPDGPIYVCFPSPPLRVDEARFSLEMGAEGVIGLVVRDISAGEAAKITAKARELAGRLCSGPWADAAAPSDDREDSQFVTCKVSGGPILAVGRFALDAAADRWQVSVAIVGAS